MRSRAQRGSLRVQLRLWRQLVGAPGAPRRWCQRDATASGLQVFTAGAGVDLSEKLNLSLDGHYFRANKVPAGVDKEIGIETNLIFTCKIKESISVLLSGNRFFTGGFFKDAAGSGKDISYAYLQAQATF